MQTGVVAQVSYNDIYNTVTDPASMVGKFGDILLKGAALDLSRTYLDVNASATVGAGINFTSLGVSQSI